MKNLTIVSGRAWLISLMVALMLTVPNLLWADACADAKRALAIAQAEQKARVKIFKIERAKSDQAYFLGIKAKEFTKKAVDEANRAVVLSRRAYAELQTASRNIGFGSEFWNTEAWQTYQAAKRRNDLANKMSDKAKAAVVKAADNERKTWDAYYKAHGIMEAALRAVEKQKEVVKAAEKLVKKVCRGSITLDNFIKKRKTPTTAPGGSSSPGGRTKPTPDNSGSSPKGTNKDTKGRQNLDKLLDKFGMGGGGVIKEYTGRARDANTEDIAIEEARRRGLDQNGGNNGGGGGGGGTPPVTMTTVGVSANCDVNAGTGTSTLSLNGTSFCSVTGTSPTFAGGTTNLMCTPGSTLTLSLSCTATNCRLNLGTVTPAGLTFTGLTAGINGPFTGVSNFTATCP